MTEIDPLPVRIEISHPVTDEPAWVLQWDGAAVSETRLPQTDPDAGDTEDWGGYSWDDGWCEEFATSEPWEVAAEIRELMESAGFNARLLPRQHE